MQLMSVAEQWSTYATNKSLQQRQHWYAATVSMTVVVKEVEVSQLLEEHHSEDTRAQQDEHLEQKSSP